MNIGGRLRALVVAAREFRDVVLAVIAIAVVVRKQTPEADRRRPRAMREARLGAARAHTAR